MAIIGSDIGASTASLFVRRNNESFSESLKRLAAGSKLATPYLDAAGVAVSGKLDAGIQRLAAASDGARNIISFSQTTDGFLGSIQGQLTRMSELAQRASDGTLSDDQRAALNAEFTQLRDQIGDFSENASFNGRQLFQDSEISTAVNQQGGTDSIETKALSLTSLGLNGLELSDQDAARTAFTNIDSAIESVTTRRAEVNADISRFQFHINNISTEQINTEAANSRIADLNIADETTQQATNSILLQASIAMVSQANSARQNVLGLLR
ncbi:MAG: flagellin [Verrucomicrobiota bacterium]